MAPTNLPERRGAPLKEVEIKLVEPDAVRTGGGSATNVASVPAQLRAATPPVHCLTNTVVLQTIASVLLAAGAASVMIDLPEETELFAGIVSIVLINVGSGSSKQHVAQRAAASVVHGTDTPQMLDPVTVGALPVRIALTRELLILLPTAIRSSASEILGLAGAGTGGWGVDSTDSVEAAVEAAWGLTDKYNTVAVISREADVVINTPRTTRIRGGDPPMPLVIGIGCSLGVLVAAALGAAREHPCPYDAVVVICALFVAVSIMTGRDIKDPASFEIAWCDALYTLLPDRVTSLVIVEEA